MARKKDGSPGKNHNRIGGIDADRLKSAIERIEKLEEEKKGIGDDIRDVFAEAKGNGFCVKTMRKVIALRKMEEAEREQSDLLLETYKRALGIGPLFDE